MKNEIETKWEWIRRRCTERGYNEAARVAAKIDETLNALYGDTITESWRRDYTIYRTDANDLSDLYMLEVIHSPQYCIGCAGRTKPSCVGCRFAEVSGSCFQRGSLFDLFCVIFHMHMNSNKEKEK